MVALLLAVLVLVAALALWCWSLARAVARLRDWIEDDEERVRSLEVAVRRISRITH